MVVEEFAVYVVKCNCGTTFNNLDPKRAYAAYETHRLERLIPSAHEIQEIQKIIPNVVTRP